MGRLVKIGEATAPRSFQTAPQEAGPALPRGLPLPGAKSALSGGGLVAAPETLARYTQERDQAAARRALDAEGTAAQGRLDELLVARGAAQAGDVFASRSRGMAGTRADPGAIDELNSGIQGARTDVSRVKYLQRYQDTQREDTFTGQFAASYDMGQMGQDEAKAWNDYLNDPTAEKRAYAEAVGQARADYTQRNTAALDGDASLPWLSQSLAGYLPQLKDQTIAGAKGALAGGVAGSVLPVAGTALGAKTGYTAGRAMYGYETARGAAFKALLDAGMPEERARAAASDEAVIQSVIEGGDAVLDLVTLGGGKAISSLLGTGAKAAAKTTAGKQLAKALAGYGLNILGEGVQEWTQEGVSIANQGRDSAGLPGLVGAAAGQIGKAVTGRDPEGLAQMNAAGVEGMKIAAMAGGGQLLANNVISGTADRVRTAPDRAIDSAYSAMQEHGLFTPETYAARQRADRKLGLLPRSNGQTTMLLPTGRENADASASAAQGATNGQTVDHGLPTGKETQKTASTGETGYDRVEADAIRREGKTFRNLVAGIDSSVSAFFEKWRNGRKGLPDAKLEKLYLGKMNENTRAAVSDILGYEVSERDFIVTNDGVKHILDTHGDPKAEVKKGNLPLTPDIIDSLASVVANPDAVRPGHIEKSSPYRQGVIFEKTLPDGTVVYIQFDNSGRGTFEGRTLYVKEKESSPSGADASVEAPTSTSKTTEPELSSAPIIADSTTEGNTQSAQNAGGVSGAEQSGPHIDERTWEDAGKRKVNAFQFDNPQLHQFFADAATGVLYDLNGSTKGERSPTKDSDGYVTGYTGTKRHTTRAVEMALDDAGLSYAQIQAALQSIIDNHGQENYAAAKKMELVLDTILTEGYTDIDGNEYGPDADYIAAKEQVRAQAEPGAEASAGVSPEDSTGAAPMGFDPYSHLQNQKDEFHPDGEKAARQVDVPTTDLEGRRIPKSAATVMESGNITDEAVAEVQRQIADGTLSFTRNTDKGAMARAEQTVQEIGWDGAVERFHQESRRGVVSKDNMALGATLLVNAAQNGDIKTFAGILADYTSMSRAGAQATQANRLLKKMSPEGQLYAVQRMVENLNSDIRERGSGGTGGNISDDELGRVLEVRDTALDLISNIHKAFSENSARAEDAAWVERIGKELASTLSKRYGAAQNTPPLISQTIIGDLVKFAEEHALPTRKTAAGQKRTAADRITDYFNNRAEYVRAWNIAQENLRAKYRNDPAALDAFESWLQGTISYNADSTDAVMLDAVVETALSDGIDSKVFSVRSELDRDALTEQIFNRLNQQVQATGGDASQLRAAVERHVNERAGDGTAQSIVGKDMVAAMREIGAKMSRIIRSGAADKAALSQKLAGMLTRDYQISADGAERLASLVVDTFNEQVSAASEKALNSILKKRPAAVRRSMEQRMTELANLGAFTSDNFNALATEKLMGQGGITIDPALMEKFVGAKNQAGRNAALGEIQQNIADQVPSSPVDKFNALRYLNMLGNLRTQSKNVAGNATMLGLRAVKDRVAAVIELGASKASKGKYQKTKAFVYDPALFKAAWKDYKEVQSAALGEQKYSARNGRLPKEVDEKRTIFKNNGTWGTLPTSSPVAKATRKATGMLWTGLEAYRRATNMAMEYGDVIFSRVNYADALGQYLAVHGVTADQMQQGSVDAGMLDDARAYAIEEAQRATFRDNNAVSGAIAKAGGLFKNPKNAAEAIGDVLIQGTVPFLKTPANVAVRMEEYSPLGLVNAMINGGRLALGSKSVTGADVVDSLAKGLTGTGLFVLGAALYNAGRLVGGPDDDDEQKELNLLTGGQNYAYVDAEGNSRTLEWLSPAAGPMFMGAEFTRLGGESGYDIWAVLEAAKSITNPMLEMSMMQGINSQLESISYSDDPLVDLTLNSLISYLTQGMTSTLGGQIERTSEDRRMTTFQDNTADMPTDMQRRLGKLSAKMPGWDFQQIPYIDAWGREESSGALLPRGAGNFLAPWFSSRKNVTETDKEIQRLLDAGQSGVVPARVPQSVQVTYKENANDETNQKRYLDAEEYVTYASMKGQTSYDIVSAMLDSDEYRAMTDEEKARAIDLAYTYAGHMAAEKVTDGKHESDKYVELAQAAKKELGLSEAEYLLMCETYGKAMMNGDNIREAYQEGIDPDDYLTYAGALKAVKGDKSSTSQVDAARALSQTGDLTDEERAALWSIQGESWKAESNPFGERCTGIRERFDLDMDTFLDALEIYNGEGKAADKKAALRELLGGYQGNQLYAALGKN